MYIPQKYKNENLAEVKAFLMANSFGILINTTDGKLWATHIPLELDQNEQGKDVLYGHISKANMQWNSFNDGTEVMCIFPGPHSYVSSSWYNFEEVPTWNYIAVHVYGSIRILNDKELWSHLKKLVDKYEEKIPGRVHLEEMSASTLKQVQGVVGFEIEIKDIQAAYKLSQSHDDLNHENVVEKLSEKEDPGSRAIAKEMGKCRREEDGI